jgi:5-methylcytosine-specific restriction protein A
MPTAPLRTCSYPNCGALVVRGRCAAHETGAWRGDSPAPPRIRGRKLQRLRDRLFSQQPLCVLCVAKGRTTLATIRDHIVPLAEGGMDDNTNVQAICKDCSDAKTAKESQRGRMKW